MIKRIAIVVLVLGGCISHLSCGPDVGMSTVVIQSDDYRAVINSDFGGNCIGLTHLPSGIAVLRTPETDDDLKASPLLYGMPLLFFPNRIVGGRFTFEGREYRWPLNEPERNTYVHGNLYQTPFRVVGRTRSSVELVFEATTDRPYLTFPHPFILRLHYTVDAEGLHQRVTVTNNSDRNMPFGLAFHTTFNVPFAPDGKASDVRLALPVDAEYPRDTTTLTPTGTRLMAYPQRDALRTGTLQPSRHVLSRFFSRHADGGMQLTDTVSGWTITYNADAHYRFWMVWNGGRDDLLTVEPQTCLIDAFNVDRPLAEKGRCRCCRRNSNKCRCVRRGYRGYCHRKPHERRSVPHCRYR